MAERRERRFTSVETQIDRAAHGILGRLPQAGPTGWLVEFLVFGLKQGWACLFGGIMLALLMGTRLWWPDAILLQRYDFLFLAALAVQLGMLALRLETLNEAKVILVFHLVGTAMEIFKTGVGSWLYPEPAWFHIGGVPLFSGFMYASIGSYMARVTRIFDIRFERYPPIRLTAILAGAIYLNFFTHHYFPDARWVLFTLLALTYSRTTMHYRVFRHRLPMPILVAFLLVALFIWIAENLGTWSHAWLYPNQREGWSMVSWAKLGSWYLLMTISVVLVTLVHPPQPLQSAIDTSPSPGNVPDQTTASGKTANP